MLYIYETLFYTVVYIYTTLVYESREIELDMKLKRMCI